MFWEKSREKLWAKKSVVKSEVKKQKTKLGKKLVKKMGGKVGGEIWETNIGNKVRKKAQTNFVTKL